MTTRRIEAALLVLIAAAATLFASRPIWNIDVFWHIAAGDYILTHGALPTQDIFSAITPERSWITFQWGYEVLTHLLDQVGGLGAVRALHVAATVGAIGLMWWGCRRRLMMGPWVSIALTLLLLVLFGDRIRARPHVFNLVGWVIAMPWLMRGPALLDRKACIGVAVTLLCWANLHAGGALIFLIAAATLPAGAVLSRMLKRESAEEEVRRAMTWYAAALVPALASPLFIRGNIQALTTFSDHEGVIGEWQPSWHLLTFVSGDSLGTSGLAHLLSGLAPSLVGIALVWALWRERHAQDTASRLPPWRALLILALVVLGHRSVRFVYVAAFALVALAPVLRHAVSLSAPQRRLVWGTVIPALLFASYGFNISAQHGSIAVAAERAFTGPHLDMRRYPTGAADFLASTDFEGHIFCQTNWGGYLRWRLGPKVRVIADGRANFSGEVGADLAYVYDRSNLGAPDAGTQREAIYSRYDVDLIVHQHPVWPTEYSPNRANFLRIFADSRGEIWLRNTPRGAAYLERLNTQKEAPP
ncbi:MAG: hypothetical protein ACPGU1_18575 [Myxococcota bacterium]